MKKLTIFILSFSLWFFSTSLAHAETLSLSLTPSLFEATVAPGKSLSQVFSVRNLGNQPVTLVARIVPFIPEDLSGLPNLKPNQRPAWRSFFSLKNADLKLDEPFRLDIDQSRSLVLSLAVPYATNPTDLYATLLLSTVLNSDNPQPGNVSLGAAIGSNLLITISGSSNPPALVRIENFAPEDGHYFFRASDYYFADNLAPILLSATARNAGKYFTKTSGQVTVNRNNQLISTQTLLPLNLLAYSSRTLAASPSGQIIFKPKLTSVGAYQVNLDIRSENGSSHSEITLVLIPAKLLAGIIICLILLLIIKKSLPKNAARHPK